MLFDAQIQVAQFEINPGEDSVQLALLLALGIPVNANQAMPIPAGILRWAFTKADAIQYGKEMQEAGESLPDEQPKSDIVIAQNLAGVEQAVKKVEGLAKGQK